MLVGYYDPGHVESAGVVVGVLEECFTKESVKLPLQPTIDGIALLNRKFGKCSFSWTLDGKVLQLKGTINDSSVRLKARNDPTGLTVISASIKNALELIELDIRLVLQGHRLLGFARNIKLAFCAV